MNSKLHDILAELFLSGKISMSEVTAIHAGVALVVEMADQDIVRREYGTLAVDAAKQLMEPANG